MDRQAATKIIRDTFENPFDKGQFVHFTKNLLNHLDESNNFVYGGNRLPNAAAYQRYINSIERIGKYYDDECKIDILIVKLKKGKSLERARTIQRNFIARYLDGFMNSEHKDAALVAFISPDDSDWRFSLVRMDYNLVESPSGKIKVEKELTPARRYSFLVGENESSHTAQVQLLPILENDKSNPLLSDLEKAFSIEVVTKEFFGKYRELFHKVEEALLALVKKDKRIREDFAAKDVDTINFSKKLLGQVVFLYFLQKKGWFGVGRDEDWGTGPKNFLRLLLEKKMAPYQNFFNDILEPLFYEALAVERTDDFYSRFNCKIPFLNGGLFDPINNYDWVHTDILLPNQLFSNNQKTKEGDAGTGILDMFDRYNFTVKEDEPLDKEVAIDPEMLGKVFENLLEVKDRKSKGTYYTPREIVHYMCQESLINYLDTAINTGDVPLVHTPPPQGKLLGKPDPQQAALKTPEYKVVVPREDIEAFIRAGESAIEHDTRVEAHGKETERYSYKLPESIRRNAELVDEKLDSIRVCDPAIGSGAFPVGMMNETIRARRTLTTYIDDETKRTPYNFKRHAIQNCLYGVDIDSGAIEIAKLRLWLSLVVDEEDIKQINPLPNLDYKIVCGNSLLGVQRDMFNNQLFQKLEELKPIYFDETNAKKKQEFRKQIDQLIKKLTNNKEIFDFEVYFSEVFHEKKGFDVVIANPPYARVQTLQQTQPENIDSYRDKFISAKGSFDIYVLFIEKGYSLLNINGIFSYILPHKFFQAKFGEPIRKLLNQQKAVFQIVRFGAEQVFDESTTYTCLLFLSKKVNTELKLFEVKSLEDARDVLNSIQAKVPHNNYQQGVIQYPLGDEWCFTVGSTAQVLEKLRRQGCTLSDVTRKIFVGLQTSADKIYVLKIIKVREKTISCFSESLESEIEIERDFVKPFLMGKDVHRYEPLNLGCVVIFPYVIRNGEAHLMSIAHIQKHFPLGWQYLLKNKKVLSGRENGKFAQNWYSFGRPQNLPEFEAIKVMTPDICSFPQMSIDETASLYHSTTLYSFAFNKELQDDTKYFLGILNSKLLWFFLKSTGTILRGGYFRFKTEYLKPFPIACSLSKSLPTKEQHDRIVALVNRILAEKRIDPASDVFDLERQIDQMVYQLYDLTPEEIAVVEGSQ